ncbi:MAG: hypothetical protein J0L88_06930 [Xanthomonadales bacterium]|nr:hypothetical protein [Xanthomonadales bacterium]
MMRESKRAAAAAARGAWSACVLLAIATAPAAAATFCVNTEATAQAALSTAATNGESDTIRFRSGAIEVTNGLLFTTASASADDQPLTLTGGYNTGCTQRTGTTSLDGNGIARILEMRIHGPQTVVIDRLSFIDGYDSQRGGNLYVGLFDTGGGASLRIDNSAFLLGRADLSAGGFDLTGFGTVRFRNNLVIGNSADDFPAGAFNITGATYLVGNTMTGNLTDDGEGWALYANPTGAASNLWLSNNILWGNDTYGDAYLFGGGSFHLVSNDIGVRTNPTLVTNTDNLSVDPQFAPCGFLCIRKPLKRASPLVDAGMNAPQGGMPAIDFDGLDRVVGPYVDIGAFELEGLFADGFD